MVRPTALYEKHVQQSVTWTEFCGWQLPLHYGSVQIEHRAVRQKAGMFDVSHMGVIDLLGAGCRTLLRMLLSRDIDDLTHCGQSLYALLCHEHGGVLDDVIVYFRAPDNFRLVCNAVHREQVLAWLMQHSEGLQVGIQERQDLSILAIQGPGAIEQTLRALPPALMDRTSTLQSFEFSEEGDWFVARTGYTGEQGFEIILPHQDIGNLWSHLLAQGIIPCGLAVRDVLRIEAGMMLSGQDMDSTTSPLSSGLAWAVDLASSREFIGKQALQSQLEHATLPKLVGVMLKERGVIRQGQPIWVEDKLAGTVTSGTFSPLLQCGIGFARIEPPILSTCHVEIRQKRLIADIIKPARFVKNGQILVNKEPVL